MKQLLSLGCILMVMAHCSKVHVDMVVYISNFTKNVTYNIRNLPDVTSISTVTFLHGRLNIVILPFSLALLTNRVNMNFPSL